MEKKNDFVLGDEEEALTCWICFELFNDPLTLNCSHSFCKECLIKLHKRNPLCAFCRRPFGMPLPPVSAVLTQMVKAFKKEAPIVDAPIADQPSSVILNVPDDVLIDIFTFLSAKDLSRLARVCRKFRLLTYDGFLWRELCKRSFAFSRPQKYGNDWRKCFIGTTKLMKGKPGEFKMIPMRGHTNYVNCFSMYRLNVVSGSADSTLKVWNITKEDALHTLSGHLGVINAVDFNELKIVSASADATVKVWDTVTGSLGNTFNHEGAVNCLQYDQASVVSGADDRKVKVWDLRNGNITRTYTGHQGGVTFVNVQGNTVVSRDSSAIKIWDLTNGNTKSTIALQNSQVFVQPNRILCTSQNNLTCYNMNGALQFTVPINSVCNSLAVEGETAVAGLQNNSIAVVDLAGRRVSKVLSDHSAPVNVVQYDGRVIISGAADNSVKVWDVSKGTRLYSLLGGTLQKRANNPDHPTRLGCSGARFDEGRIVASFQSLLRCYSFEDT